MGSVPSHDSEEISKEGQIADMIGRLRKGGDWSVHVLPYGSSGSQVEQSLIGSSDKGDNVETVVKEAFQIAKERRLSVFADYFDEDIGERRWTAFGSYDVQRGQ